MSNDNYKLVDKDKCKVEHLEIYKDTDGNRYTKVDYIESTGDKFIDTEYSPNSDTEVEMSFKTVQKNGRSFLFGSRNAGSKNQFGVFFEPNSNKYTARYGSEFDNTYDAVNYVQGDYSNDKSTILLSKDGYSFNDNNVNVRGNITQRNSIYIFGINTGGLFESASSYKLYSFQIKVKNVLVRDYVPVIDKNNNVCLFDKIGRKCYHLLDENSFQTTYYYDNNNNRYTRVRYIESTGTQYIDTLFAPNDSSELEMLFKTNQALNNYSFLFGSRNAGGQNQFGVYYDSNKYIARYGSDNNYVQGDYSNNKTIMSLSKNGYGFNYSSINVGGSVVKNKNIYLFGINTDGVFGAASAYQLYGCTITDKDSLIRDFVPVLDKNNRPCLYDRIEKKCYYNQGSGEFLYG